jgi:anti-sigma B factor antagonist
MALEVKHREQEGIEILVLRGRLTLGDEDLLLRSEIDSAIAGGKVRVVMDLGNVTEIDSTGVGTLLFALARLREAGGGLALANLRPAHMKLLVVAKLEMVFEVFSDDQDAINSFFPDRHVRRYDLLELIERIRGKRTRDHNDVSVEGESKAGSVTAQKS